MQCNAINSKKFLPNTPMVLFFFLFFFFILWISSLKRPFSVLLRSCMSLVLLVRKHALGAKKQTTPPPLHALVLGLPPPAF